MPSTSVTLVEYRGIGGIYYAVVRLRNRLTPEISSSLTVKQVEELMKEPETTVIIKKGTIGYAR